MGLLGDVFKTSMTGGVTNRQVLRTKQNISRLEMMLKIYKDKFEKEQDAGRKERIKQDITKIEKDIVALKELLKQKTNE